MCGHTVGGVIKWEGGVNCRLCDYLSVRLIRDVVLGEGGVVVGCGGVGGGGGITVETDGLMGATHTFKLALRLERRRC